MSPASGWKRMQMTRVISQQAAVGPQGGETFLDAEISSIDIYSIDAISRSE